MPHRSIALPACLCCSVSASQEDGVALHKAFSSFISIESMDVVPLCGGLSPTRRTLRCTVNGKSYAASILSALPAQRKREVQAHFLAAKNGFAPTLYYHNDDNTLIIMDFVEGKTLSIDQARNIEVLNKMSQALNTMSHIQLDLPANNVFSYMKEIYDRLIGQQTSLSPLITQVAEIVKTVEQKIINETRPTVFSHCDLNPRNIFFVNQKLSIIDWEGASICYEFFDLASFSILLCLDEKSEASLLEKYLQKKPTPEDLKYLQSLKLTIRAFDAFKLFDSLKDLKELADKIDPTSIENFVYYETLCANDSTANSSEFVFKLALSELQELLRETT